jgi:ATP-dependent protease ClpP protease subunit
MKNFSFKMAGKTLEILFYGEIGDDLDGISAKMFAESLKPHASASEIVLRMNSIGGDAYEGSAIYNILNRHRARKVVTVDGAALSAASLVAMAGDEIVMAENAVMMIHEPWGIEMGTAADLRSYADKLEKLTGIYATTYAKRSGLEYDDVLAVMHEETWLTAQEAVESGFATSVVESKRMAAMAVPKGRFKRTPISLMAKEDAAVSLYREKLLEATRKTKG